MTGGHREGDERFDQVTARRPVLEAALASCAEETYGLTVRRGSGVAGLRTAEIVGGTGTPRVAGVRTEAGEDLDADLVVDASGRRTPVRRWLADIGARPPVEEVDECGGIYYARHFRSFDGCVPRLSTFILQEQDSLSLVTLPADNGTWSVVISACARDAALRPLRDPQVWTRTVARYPHAEHWLDGTPTTGVDVIAKLEDRWRSLVVDGEPVVTGLVGLGDAWACTSPALGRGASIGLTHACLLRDLLREVDLREHEDVTRAWADRTDATVGEMFRMTRAFDHHRLAEMQADADGTRYEPEDPVWARTKALAAASFADPDVFRARLDVVNLLATPAEVMARPGLAERVIALSAGAGRYALPGPDRAELLALVGPR
jgi:2-polyprenyl-6-methoxyphenol hydroxylase-like FAD-dependent oxidoreductase